MKKTYNNNKMKNERFGVKGYGASGTATDSTQCVGRIEKWEERARWMELLRKRNKHRREQEQQTEKPSTSERNEPSTSHHIKTTRTQERTKEEQETKRIKREHKHRPHKHKQTEGKTHQLEQGAIKKNQILTGMCKHKHMTHQHTGTKEDDLNSPMSPETSDQMEEEQEEESEKGLEEKGKKEEQTQSLGSPDQMEEGHKGEDGLFNCLFVWFTDSGSRGSIALLRVEPTLPKKSS